MVEDLLGMRCPTIHYARAYYAQWDFLILENGILKRHVELADGTKRKLQLIVPQEQDARSGKKNSRRLFWRSLRCVQDIGEDNRDVLLGECKRLCM